MAPNYQPNTSSMLNQSQSNPFQHQGKTGSCTELRSKRFTFNTAPSQRIFKGNSDNTLPRAQTLDLTHIRVKVKFPQHSVQSLSDCKSLSL